MILLAASLYLGLFALAAGMSRHTPALLGPQAPALASHARQIGWGLLGVSLLCVALAPNWGYALLIWFGLVPALGAVLLLGLTYAAWLTRAAAVVAVLGVAVGTIGAMF